MAKTNGTIYFPGLNGLRAIAALSVVVVHIGQNLDLFGHKSIREWGMAGHAVTLFFVLSGFLITYLLLKEREKNGSISKKKFYSRRVLRIWPVYYLAIIVSVLLLNHYATGVEWSTLFFFIFFMPNIPFSMNRGMPAIEHLWSIGVEEQFYLFWPWIAKTKKFFFYSMWGVLVAFIVGKVLLRYFENGAFYSFMMVTRFQCMAIGGLLAWYYFYYPGKITFLYNKYLQIVVWSVFIVSLIKPIHIASLIDSELYAILFGVLIINVSTNSQTIISLENRVFDYLGKVSYGTYVYHSFAILLMNVIYQNLDFKSQLIIYAGCLGFTVLMAHVSYFYFEKFFLKLKEKYMVVKSSSSKE